MDKLIETFCDVDDFCQLFIEQWQQQLIEIGELKRRTEESPNDFDKNHKFKVDAHLVM